MNIFSIFDPMMNILLSLNWIMLILSMIFPPLMFWKSPSRFNMLWLTTMNFLQKELDLILKLKIYFINFIPLFIIISITNFLGLFSYIFTSSSHLSMNLALSLPYWMSFMLLGWLFNPNFMFSHQIPQGTPPILMPFMVMIEFISNLIRPGTLSIRLTANMIAGHLLLTLISNNGNKLIFPLPLILIFLQTLLMILEMSVAMIQAYVFMFLISLYSKEI